MHSVRSRGRRHRKRRLVRELGGSRQGNRHPWWFSPDDRDWLCSPDRSRRCVSLHMLVTAAEFLLGPTVAIAWTGWPTTRCLRPGPASSDGPIRKHPTVASWRPGGGSGTGGRKRDRSDIGGGSGTGPILLSQVTFLLAHIANSGPVPFSAPSGPVPLSAPLSQQCPYRPAYRPCILNDRSHAMRLRPASRAQPPRRWDRQWKRPRVARSRSERARPHRTELSKQFGWRLRGESLCKHLQSIFMSDRQRTRPAHDVRP